MAGKGVNTHYICVGCKRQFIDSYDQKEYTEDIKSECLEMYVNGFGFRAIERVKKINHTTVINWVKELCGALPDTPNKSEIPEITEVDELETFIGKKKKNLARDSGKS
jgi:transposase-like protein